MANARIAADEIAIAELGAGVDGHVIEHDIVLTEVNGAMPHDRRMDIVRERVSLRLAFAMLGRPQSVHLKITDRGDHEMVVRVIVMFDLVECHDGDILN